MPVADGDAVTLDYTPGALPIQDTAGNPSEAFTGQFVGTGDWQYLLCDRNSGDVLLELRVPTR
jgi:hypothetical protein